MITIRIIIELLRIWTEFTRQKLGCHSPAGWKLHGKITRVDAQMMGLSFRGVLTYTFYINEMITIHSRSFLLVGGAITNHLEQLWSESQWAWDDIPLI